MQYNIKAIPTTYAGVNFRSRLEARWAAFFDLCGWQWDYEPFDLDGWAPDFMLKGKIKALVEIKPIDFRGDEKQLFSQAHAKARKAFEVPTLHALGKPVEYEIIVVGNGPFKTDWWNPWSLGVFAPQICDEEWDDPWNAEHKDVPTFGCDVADLFFGANNGPHLDYAARYGSYQYRVGGQYDGDGHLWPINDDTPQDLWRTAGNVVQWIPRRAA